VNKAELADIRKSLDKVKLELISKGMPYSLVRRMDDAQAAIDKLIEARSKKNA